MFGQVQFNEIGLGESVIGHKVNTLNTDSYFYKTISTSSRFSKTIEVESVVEIVE